MGGRACNRVRAGHYGFGRLPIRRGLRRTTTHPDRPGEVRDPFLKAEKRTEIGPGLSREQEREDARLVVREI